LYVYTVGFLTEFTQSDVSDPDMFFEYFMVDGSLMLDRQTPGRF